jgi:RNA methyltransferase, TrmH family
MPLREIQSKQNARLKQLRKVLAAPGRETQGLAGIEGPHLLEEALRAGLRVVTVFAAQDPDRAAENLLAGLRMPAATEVIKLPKKLLDSALATETPQPIAALVAPPDWTWAHVLGGSAKTAPLILVLDGIQDPGNLGTIVRSAEAFGATGIVSLPGTVHAWNPKAVRASAGSMFRMPLIAASQRACIEQLREAGVRILATTALAAESAEQVDLAEPIALVVGNEGNGVAKDLAARADGAVMIPCPGPVESLNAAVAASVLLYEASRQRVNVMGKHSSKSLHRAAGARR